MKLHLATAVAILTVMVGCSGMKTTTDYDREADFTQYSTYAWHDGTGSDISDSDPLNHERLISAIDAQMQQHGRDVAGGKRCVRGVSGRKARGTVDSGSDPRVLDERDRGNAVSLERGDGG